ncbi:hypothetical protein FJZ22_03195 [Candidatus Pacearchaeota archaeon]|nr:hypothetical protein [Candidatus Pacearchaeota archaeon]
MPEVITEARIRDNEERQRLLKERVLLIGQTLVELREGLIKELTETRKMVNTLQTDLSRLKEVTRNLTEQSNNNARKEEVAIIQRQLDMLRA